MPPANLFDTSSDDLALSEQLADEVQRRIFLGDYPVGSWLRHDALAEEYGVSRTPVREALRVLQARGSVEIKRHRGAQVKQPSPRDIRDLGDVRATLEGLAAERAAERIKDIQLERLEKAWHGYRDGVEAFVKKPTGAARDAIGERWVKANQEFHDVIQEASGNRQLRITLGGIYTRYPPNLSHAAFGGDSRLLLQNVEEHENIAEAIRTNDPAAAKEAMEDHIRASTELVARWLEDMFDSSADS